MNKKVFYGWWIVIGFFFIMIATVGIGINTFSVFFKPIIDSFGFSRGEFSLTFSMIALSMMLAAPVAAKIVDKIGIRVLMAFSAIIYILGYGLFSQCRTIPQFYVCAALVGIGMAGTYLIPVSVLITNWFHEKRSLAMSISMAGGAVGTMVFGPVNNWLIINFGWEKAFVIIAIVIAIFTIPFSLFVVRLHPSDMGLVPYGFSKENANISEDLNSGLTFSEAVKTVSFWFFGSSSFIMGILIMGLQMHYPSYLEDVGFTSTFAAIVLSTTGGVAIFGNIIFGEINDRFGTKKSVLYIFLGYAVSLIILIGAKTTWIALTFSIFFGLVGCMGTLAIPLWIVEIVGKKDYAINYSIINIFFVIGVALGSPLTGYFFDVKGSYLLVWLIYIVLSIIAMVLGLAALVKSKLVANAHVKISA